MHLDPARSDCSESLQKESRTNQDYLTDYSPNDKPWDVHKAQSLDVAELLDLGFESHQKQAKRMRECAQRLNFAWSGPTPEGETHLRLKSTYFCRVRQCPICQWRRSLMWISRFYKAFPVIYANHPEWRYIMLTLTVKNCQVVDLRSTISDMNKAWDRMTKRKIWPALGFVRTLEVTRSKDGSAHPHFHCLLAVPPGYFVGRKYLSTAKWANLWADCLRVDYTPICEVHTVKPRDYSGLKGQTIWETPEQEAFELGMDEVRNGVLLHGQGKDDTPINPTKVEILVSAVVEVIKYAVKPDDMMADPDWLIELSTQLRNSKAVFLGGELRKYLAEEEPENLINEGELTEPDTGKEISFGWRERVRRYKKA